MMYTNYSQDELYCLGFLSGASRMAGDEDFLELRRSAHHSMKFVRKTLHCFGNLVTDVYSSSRSATIFWRSVDLDARLRGLTLDGGNYEAFTRGCLDVGFMSSGCHLSERPHLQLVSGEGITEDLLILIEKNLGAKSKDGRFFDVDALDIMGKLYTPDVGFGYSKALQALEKWRTQVDGLNNSSKPKFFFSKTRYDAVPPFKARISDSGFDLTLLDKVKSIGSVDMYSTGIVVRPAYGWYFMLVPRSSIIKSGYMLANNCGIIDRSYTGEILVPLVKVDDNAPHLDMPCRLVQLVPQPIIDFEFMETDDKIDSIRGTKGFGSSGT
jgi:deoxyuridine 5'-triphosphate nucleotidohydrolase